MKVYISSTFSDLAEHRRAVQKAIESLKADNFEYTDIHALSPEEQPPLETCLKAVSESQFFVLLLGWRYGYVAEGLNKSISELEYEAAVKNGLVILPYIIDENYAIPAKFIDKGESAKRLLHFKQQLREKRLLKYFTSPKNLSSQVIIDLSTYSRKSLREGAQDIIDKPYLEKELSRCKNELSQYDRTISALRTRLASVVPAIPIWNTRNFITDTTLCFVLMPFQDDFFSVYEEGILPALDGAGLRGLHAGEIFDNREIIENIWESICTARIIIADVTGRNPNVFYELGICHTLGKEVVIITQNGEDVPFDIRHRRYLIYNPTRLVALKNNLEKTIQKVILRSKNKEKTHNKTLKRDAAKGRRSP